MEATAIKISVEQTTDVLEFMALAKAAWNKDLSPSRTALALSRTINIGARCEGRLVGMVRVLTDGYLFGTVPELMVHPDFQRQGIARGLMERAYEESPTGLFLGAQPGLEGFYESLGFEPSLKAFHRRKPA